MVAEKVGLTKIEIDTLISALGGDGFDAEMTEIRGRYEEKEEVVVQPEEVEEKEEVVVQPEEVEEKEEVERFIETFVKEERVKPKSLSEFFDVIANNDGEDGKVVIEGLVNMILTSVVGGDGGKKTVFKMKVFAKLPRKGIVKMRGSSGVAITKSMNEFGEWVNREGWKGNVSVGKDKKLSENWNKLSKTLTRDQQELLENRVVDLVGLWEVHPTKGRNGINELLEKSFIEVSGVHAYIRTLIVKGFEGKKIDTSGLLSNLKTLLSSK